MFTYERQYDLHPVKATMTGNLVSLVAFDQKGNPIDSWDGLLRDVPARFYAADFNLIRALESKPILHG